jgi:hypothetical protein
MTRRTKLILTTLTIVIALGGYVVTAAPSGPRSMRDFDPVRRADLELRMWQAYYSKENVRLFGLLVTMLREQYQYSWATASKEAFHLARAAAAFGNMRSNYESVLPDLEAGYRTARDWMGTDFDPAVVAKAELAWWVARRIDGQNSPEQVGGLIADEYALLYSVPREKVLQSGILRARAGRLRDETAQAPDWNEVARLLTLSYQELSRAVNN